MQRLMIIAAATFAVASPALADHTTPRASDKGVEASGGTARTSGIAAGDGTLHPGHVAIYATGKGSVSGSSKFNKPAYDYHLGDGYGSGPGGYADTKKNANALD